jgi:hypothetical protein
VIWRDGFARSPPNAIYPIHSGSCLISLTDISGGPIKWIATPHSYVRNSAPCEKTPLPEPALRPLYVTVGSAALVTAWIELSGGTASDRCRSFGALRQSPRCSPSFSLPRDERDN